MKKSKKSELRKMDVSSLKKQLGELSKELMKLNAQVASKTKLESPGKVGSIKRNRARILTILNQKKETKK